MRTVLLPRTLLKLLEQPNRVREIVRIEMLLYRMLLVILDVSLTYTAFIFAYIVRFSSQLSIFEASIIPNVPEYRNFMIYAIPVWLLIFAATGLYSSSNLLGGTREYSLLFNATILGVFIIISAGFLFPDDLLLARGWVLLAWFFTFAFSAAGRFLARRLVYSLRKQGHFKSPAIVVGANEEADLLVDQFLQSMTSGIQLVGYVSNERNHRMDAKLTWLGRIEDLAGVIGKQGISELLLTSSALSQMDLLTIFRRFGTAEGINMRMSSGLYEIITTGMKVNEDSLVPMVTINKVRMTGFDEVLKTILDYCIALPLTVVLLPFMALIALAVKLDSPGPAIYRRRVMGVNGKQFDAFKFRTMRVDSEEILRSNSELLKEYKDSFKIKNDPRVTRLGKYLRKFSLDELPQLLNVLRNEMSVVGPRMITPEELGKYSQWDINLLTVKPGITGMWQVHGRSDVSYEERVRLDMHYIRNWTFWLDLHLLLETVPAVLTRRGAY